MRRGLRALGVATLVLLVGLGVAYLASPIDPLGWQPAPPAPLVGPLSPNRELARAVRSAEGVRGPEDVVKDARGRLVVSAADGRLVRIDGERMETLADTGGRPLGLAFAPNGDLYVCDAFKGLLRLREGGPLETLLSEAGGVPLGFTDALDLAADGRVYFSDASTRWNQRQYLYDLLEARPYGRLLRFDPATGRTETLLEGLFFANGVALAADESFVLVNETYRNRIRRLWLAGPRAGASEVVVDALPGYPDNLTRSPRGTFWVALFTVRNAAADALHPRPWAKRLLASLPRAFWPRPARYGLAIEIDGDGRVLRSLHDPSGSVVPQVTTARELDGELLLGNLDHHGVARVKLP